MQSIPLFTTGTLCLALLAGDLEAQRDRRCATHERGPNAGQEAPGDCSYNLTNPLAQYAPGSTYQIRVVVHVITDKRGRGNVSDTSINQQMAVLDQRFASAGISFTLAGVTRSANNRWYRDGGRYYNSLAWDTNQYMNVYCNTAGGNLGYVPNLPQGGGLVGTNADRVVMLSSTIGNPAPYGAPYNLGLTLVHEVGHYLGLFHTFQGGCTNSYSSGDRIVDTNAESQPHYGCASRTTCGSPDPIDNYMDYSDDACMTEFTSEQIRRMRCTLESWRPNVYNVLRNAGIGSRRAEDSVDSFRAALPVLGKSLRAGVDLSTTGHDQAALFAFGAPAALPFHGGTLLGDPATLLFSLPPQSGPLATFSVPLPADPRLQGVRLYTQALHVGGASGFALSNSQDLVLGF